MALAKDRMPHGSLQHQLHSSDNHHHHHHHRHLSYNAGFVFRSAASASNCYEADEEDHDSVINFKSDDYTKSFTTHNNVSASLLNFEKINNDSSSHDHDSSNCINISCDDLKCFQRAASNYNPSHEAHHGSESGYGWLYSSDPTLMADSFTESETQVGGGGSIQKRPHKGESMQPIKRQCTNDVATTKKPKSAKSSTPSKDPQSIAAKNRRERISERLKILQELVPNGCKVDLVTMLEKAISYVKFLQLQVKVLATDEFWPVQGGKAPNISQVKEAIDAILSSQRDTSSSSKL